MDSLPVYFHGDAQVMLRAGTLNDDRMLVFVLNTGFDFPENIQLVFDKEPKSINMLCADGEERPVIFSEKNNITTVKAPAEMLKPVILIVEN